MIFNARAFAVFCTVFGAMSALSANERTRLDNLPEKTIEVAEPVAVESVETLQHTATKSQADEMAQIVESGVSQAEIEQALHYAINNGDVDAVKVLVAYYRQLSGIDPILVEFADAQIAQKSGQHDAAIESYRRVLAQNADLTPVRIQLATSLFLLNRNSDARQQFEAALSDQALPNDIRYLVGEYLSALNRRNQWQFSVGANYLREKNINNASNDAYIENTAFRKNDSMLPQKANGFAYSVGIDRDFNLKNAHFLRVENSLYGKAYWDNHSFDEITNRTYIGYVYKQGDYQFALLPFYERQWYGNHSYKWALGGRANWSWWFKPNWQLSTAMEYGKQRYFDSGALNGHNRLASATLLWRIKPTRFVYVGADFSREHTRTRQYSYDLKTVRLGWGEEWGWGISSRFSLSLAKRDYKDHLALAGGAFRFDKARSDKIYQANATVWKRDWHLFGITPKLNFRWKQQKSNFPSLYSYTDKSANILLEKSF